MGTVIVAKGVSGSGKSSRVFQLLKYFQSIGATCTDFVYTNVEGEKKTVGILVEELGVIFIGKIYKSGNVERWQGYDCVTGYFKKAEHFSEFLKENVGKYSFIVEGAGITRTNRLRPEFLAGLGFDKIYIQYYSYLGNDIEDYHKRIVYRNGEVPKKGTMWLKNMDFIAEHVESVKEMNKFPEKEIYVFENDFDAPIFDFGTKALMVFRSDDMIPEFMEFCNEFDYISKNKFENFQ